MKPDMLLELLSQNIRKARITMGLSQMELAERADISTGHMNDIERSRRWLSAVTFSRIAEALQLEPYQLLLPAHEEHRMEDYRKLIALKKELQGMLTREIDSVFSGLMEK
jgi:transcriptional regulator with XRE-family HTH domain